MRCSLALLSLCLCTHARAFGPPSIQANQEGIKKFAKEDYPGAFKDFAKALGKNSHNPVFHFNLGDAFAKNGDVPKALAEYEAAENDQRASPDLKFKAMFNAGNAALGAKDMPKALNYYQRALEYKPGSKEVKTNIELALKDDNGGGGENKDQKDKKDQNDKDQKDKKDKKDQKDKGDKDNQKNDEPKDDKKPDEGDKPKDQGPKEQPTPKPFSSQNLNDGDVGRILEELKRQEEQIRAKQNTQKKDTPEKQIEKDW